MLYPKYEYNDKTAKRIAKEIQAKLTLTGTATMDLVDFPNQPVKLQIEHVQGKEYRAFAFGTRQNWITPIYTGKLIQSIDSVLWYLHL